MSAPLSDERGVLAQAFGELLGRLALDAINTQQILDRVWAGTRKEGVETAEAGEQLQFFRGMADAVLPSPTDPERQSEARALLASLVPSRMRVGAWEAECRIEIITRRGHSYGVYLRPRTALWERRFGTSATNDSSVRLTITAPPFPDQPAALTGDLHDSGF